MGENVQVVASATVVIVVVVFGRSKVDAESAVRTGIVTRANAKTGSALRMSQRGNAAHTRTRSVLTH